LATTTIAGEYYNCSVDGHLGGALKEARRTIVTCDNNALATAVDIDDVEFEALKGKSKSQIAG